MEGTASIFLPNKKLCGKGFEDRISELPDEIILIILASLSLREAVATSVLSSRWSDLWKHIPNLDFFTEQITQKDIPEIQHTSWDAEKCKYAKMVNSVIQSHKALPLDRFRTRFYVNKSSQSTVTKWLEFASSRKVKFLELNLQCWGITHLVVLKDSLRGISSFGFESLTRLLLKCVVVNGEDISLFLQNCPLLKALIIHSSHLASDIDVCGAALALEELEIRYCGVYSPRIRISAPKLTWVRVEARSKKRLLFENVPKLVRVSCVIGGEKYRFKQFASLVSRITSQLQILTIVLYHSQRVLVGGKFPKMPNLKKLTVIDKGVHEHGGLLPVIDLIWASPRLQVFKLKCKGEIEDPTFLINVERCQHQHLETFEYYGPCDLLKDSFLELVTHISNNCDALRKMILGPKVSSEAGVLTTSNNNFKINYLTAFSFDFFPPKL